MTLTLYTLGGHLGLCLHILSVLTNLVLFFKASDPNQHVKKKVKINSIKHSHKSFVNIKTYELPIKVHGPLHKQHRSGAQ